MTEGGGGPVVPDLMLQKLKKRKKIKQTFSNLSLPKHQLEVAILNATFFTSASLKFTVSDYDLFFFGLHTAHQVPRDGLHTAHQVPPDAFHVVYSVFQVNTHTFLAFDL